MEAGTHAPENTLGSCRETQLQDRHDPTGCTLTPPPATRGRFTFLQLLRLNCTILQNEFGGLGTTRSFQQTECKPISRLTFINVRQGCEIYRRLSQCHATASQRTIMNFVLQLSSSHALHTSCSYFFFRPLPSAGAATAIEHVKNLAVVLHR